MWFYKGKEFTENDIGNAVGFVYKITNKSNGKMYLGKKLFTKAKTYQLKGKKKKTRIASDWQEYFGSNDTLKEEVVTNGPENYHREILHLCQTLSECSYLETYEIFVQGALVSDMYYNEWVSCKIRKTHLKNLKKSS